MVCSSSDHLIPLIISPRFLLLYNRYINIYRSAISFNLLGRKLFSGIQYGAVLIIIYYLRHFAYQRCLFGTNFDWNQIHLRSLGPICILEACTKEECGASVGTERTLTACELWSRCSILLCSCCEHWRQDWRQSKSDLLEDAGGQRDCCFPSSCSWVGDIARVVSIHLIISMKPSFNGRDFWRKSKVLRYLQNHEGILLFSNRTFMR